MDENTQAATSAPSTDLAALVAAAEQAAKHPFVPGPVRELLPALARVLQAQAAAIAELRELVRPPCEGCGERLQRMTGAAS